MSTATMDIMNSPIPWLVWTGIHMSPWKLIGLTGALMFGGRWLVQFVGSLMTLSYFVFSQKQDSVGIIQNLFPAFTAVYSLYLDIKHRGWHRDRNPH